MSDLPAPLHAEDCVTALEPKQQGLFPDPIRFPPPRGYTGDCGCLFTLWSRDGRCTITEEESAELVRLVNAERAALEAEGKLRDQYDHCYYPLKLETIWQPLWDTQVFDSTSKQVYFFQQGENRRGRAATNVVTPGSLTWPKKFSAWELELEFTEPPEDLGFIDRATLRSALITLQIGEKRHFELPLIGWYQATPRRYKAAVTTPLFIPSVQYFHLQMEWARENAPKRFGQVRASLNGYLHREIP